MSAKNLFKKSHFYRAIKLDFHVGQNFGVTKNKQNKIKQLIIEYRNAVNFFIKHIYNNCLNINNSDFGLNGYTLLLLKKYNLSERYKSQALKQAIEIIKSIDNKIKENLYQSRFKKRKAKCPYFTGYPILDAKFVKIRNIDPQNSKRFFDLSIKLSTLELGKRINLLFHKEKHLKKWIDKAEEVNSYYRTNFKNNFALIDSGLVDGCELRDNYIIVFVKIRNIIQIKGDKKFNNLILDKIKNKEIMPQQVYGLDSGIKKAYTITNKENLNDVNRKTLVVGRNNDWTKINHILDCQKNIKGWHEELIEKKVRKKRGSKASIKAKVEYKNKINYSLNQLFKDNKESNAIKVLAVENLKNIKYKQNWLKLLFWSEREMNIRLLNKCIENCVFYTSVSSYYNSQTCPICHKIEKANRNGENYVCACTSNIMDADEVASFNVRKRFLDNTKFISKRSVGAPLQ